MSCAAVVAVKHVVAAKSRLAAALSAAARARLVETMLMHVLGATKASTRVHEILIVSPQHRRIATPIVTVVDDACDLSAAFESGAKVAAARGHRFALLLPADLPLVTAQDLDALIEAAGIAGAALASDRIGVGTNALCLPLELPIRLAFGPESRARHIAALGAAGFFPALIERPGVALDVDVVKDLDRLRDITEYRFLARSRRYAA